MIEEYNVDPAHLQRPEVVFKVLSYGLGVLRDLLQQLVQRGQVGPVGVGGVLHQVVAVVARLADLLAVAAGVAGAGVLHAAVAPTTLDLGLTKDIMLPYQLN